MSAFSRRALAVAAIAATSACTIHDTNPPPITGPSGLALALTVAAAPDTINQDGGSQSVIRVTAVGPDGRGVSSLPIRMDMRVNGVAQDFGTLSARTIVTGSDGSASTVFTAPPRPTNGIFGTCNGLAGNCVSVVATAAGTDFSAANPASVDIRLVPPGVILPPASAPTAEFIWSPAQPLANVPTNFDASSSQVGAGAAQITSYQWSFGDGATGTGRTLSHTFSVGGAYNVTLTVTNDRGLTASATHAVSVSPATLPTAQFTVSPSAPTINAPVFFNGAQSTPGPGHQSIVSYSWTFGDGTTAAGQVVSHVYTVPATYTVQLTVTDDSGASATSAPQQVQVTRGDPVAVLSLIKSGGMTVQADASASVATGTSRITTYTFIWGDGTQDVQNVPVATHTYPSPVAPATSSSFTITVRVADELGRSGTATQQITLP